MTTSPTVPNRTGPHPASSALQQADDLLIEQCIARVEQFLIAAEVHAKAKSRIDRGRAERLRLVATQPDVADFTLRLTDDVLRITSAGRAAKHFRSVVGSAFLSGLPLIDRLLLRAGSVASHVAPRPVMALVKRRVRQEASATVIDASPSNLARHRSDRTGGNQPTGGTEVATRVLNYNRLGEAVLGNNEADHRRRMVIELIEQPGTTNVSVKLSAVTAQLSVLAFELTVDRASMSLRSIFRAALKNDVYVNLDMEEYRDLEITASVFMGVLDEPEFKAMRAGIVLQAYLPDSHGVAERLGEWAVQRTARGGEPIGVRLVKGANLAMELVDAEQHGWNPATYETKADVDASWKRLLDTLLSERFDGCITVGVASHNLFDIAWAIEKKSTRIRFEMLEGMADPQAAAVLAVTGNLLMYTPVVTDDDFVAAIGYLTRRLDENTSPENFLRALFDLKIGSAEFDNQASRFRAAVHGRHSVSNESHRAQSAIFDGASGFENAPDSDFTQLLTRRSVNEALSLALSLAVSDPAHKVQTPQIVTSAEAVNDVVSAAREGLVSWSSKNGAERATILRRLASVVADQRLQIIGALSMYAAKTIAEADPEVSEAIDFANYYALQAEQLDVLSSGGSPGESPVGSPVGSPAGSRPLGVIVVAPPWNFAYAIALGGVTAALAAGNTVILKPTPQTPQIAQLIAVHCWNAGVPKSALHLLAVPDDHVGQHLITHDGVDAVILTGGVQTAQMFLSWKPTLHLLAETSGKNALVITATADLDLAIKDLVKSAFGHAGQKCSAASLAIVEASVYDDPAFMSRLADAVTTLNAGPSTDPATDIPPLIESPSPHLLRALTQLEAGETWLVVPRNWDVSDDRSWTPGVRAGVAPGSWFHTTECFGPVLGLMRADDLDHAIRLQNHVAFGLTAGIHALDPAEVELWTEAVQAGNLYVNRSITGAVVGRQPFGGWKASSVGPTAKAGGPSYILGLRRWSQAGLPAGSQAGFQAGLPAGSQMSSLRAKFEVFERELESLFAAETELGGMRSESNVLRYRALPKGVLVRVGQDVPRDVAENGVMLAGAAARATNCSLTISTAETETDSQFVSRLAAIRPDRLRVIGTIADDIRSAAHGFGITIDDCPIVPIPAVELTRWSREQSVSTTMHRHGRLIRAVGSRGGR